MAGPYRFQMIKVLSREPDRSMLGFSAEVASDYTTPISTQSASSPLPPSPHPSPIGNLQ